MIHQTSDVKSSDIGEGTRIWQYAVIFEKAIIGANCNICSHTLIENQVTIGNNVTVKSGVFLWDGITVESDVFIGPNVTFCNDKYPRSKQFLHSYPQTVIKRGASIGANATILPNLVLGKMCLIGAGSVVTKNVPDYAVVMGNPARVIRFIEKTDG